MFFYRYLQEYDPLGTGGGLYLFRDQIQAGNPEAIIVIHSDIFCIPPLNDMLDFFRRINAEECGKFVILGTQVIIGLKVKCSFSKCLLCIKSSHFGKFIYLMMIFIAY